MVSKQNPLTAKGAEFYRKGIKAKSFNRKGRRVLSQRSQIIEYLFIALAHFAQALQSLRLLKS